jgi:dihydrofolate synthase / folylpolyglutamate synthase
MTTPAASPYPKSNDAPLRPGEGADLASWLDYLLAIHPTEIDMGLTRVASVARTMGLTQLAPAKVVTVAGTNGKGTTCAYLESILSLAGYRVGVYSSPHLIKFNERVRINGEDASDKELVAAFEAIEAARGQTSLTFFEFATLAGLSLFKEASLDVIILEVGLGGRLDATNIIDADIGVLTAIDLDHQAFLGNTRELVGREKAGIFRPARPAIVGEPDLPASVDEVMQALGASAWRVGHEFNYHPGDGGWHYQGQKFSLKDLPLPQLPLPNAATAIAVIEQGWDHISPELIGRGIACATLTGRMERVCERPLVLLDVAHNPHAARYLAQQLGSVLAQRRQQKPGTRLFALCGMLKDKDIGAVLPVVAQWVDNWALVSLDCERGATADSLYLALPSNASAQTFEAIGTAWEHIEAQITEDDVVIVFGSFYTVAGYKSLMDRK